MRRIMMATAALAAALTFTACRDSDRHVQDQREDLAKTEAKARENIADIRQDARKDEIKRDERAQKDIAHEEQKVEDKREDLAKAEQDRSNDAVRADDRVVTDHDRVVTDHDRVADRTDRRHLAAPAHANATVTGTLKSTFGSQLTIRDSRGGEFKLGTDDATRVMSNGHEVKIDDYKEGTEVRASYALDGDKKVARDVEVLRPIRK